MRVPPFERYEKSLVGAGLFLVGLIVGCALFMTIYQRNFSLLSIQNQQMRTEIESLKTTNENLSFKQKKATQTVIHSIKVVFERKNEPAKLDEISENELRKKIAQDLQFLNGKAIARIKEDPLLYRNLIDGKTYHAIHERDYIVYVRTLLVVEAELTVTINVVSARN
jgi:transcription initiation factor TFIIIB Brf1 subunit/transcription initiation factor TFIIB